MRDLTESEFIGQRDLQNNPLPTNPLEGSPVDEWTLRSELSGGRLLGKSCEGTLRLAGHSKEFSQEGYKFGKHLALAWQVSARPWETGNRFIQHSLKITYLYVLFSGMS